MAITKEKKKEIIEKVKEIIKNASSAVFVNFHGLSVGETTQLRKDLRSEESGYLVAKKTLVKRALADSKVIGDQPVLDGEFALVYGSDLIAPARGVASFQKTHKDKISILGGIFEGAYMNKDEMTVIASIPPQKVLYAQFVNLINSPIQRFVVVLNQIAEKRV